MPQCHDPGTRSTVFIINYSKTEQRLQPSVGEILCFYYKIALTPATSPLFSLKEVVQKDLNFTRTSSNSPLLAITFSKVLASKPWIFYNTLPQGTKVTSNHNFPGATVRTFQAKHSYAPSSILSTFSLPFSSSRDKTKGVQFTNSLFLVWEWVLAFSSWGLSENYFCQKRKSTQFSAAFRKCWWRKFLLLWNETHNHADWDSRKALLILIHNSLAQGRVKSTHAVLYLCK